MMLVSTFARHKKDVVGEQRFWESEDKECLAVANETDTGAPIDTRSEDTIIPPVEGRRIHWLNKIMLLGA